MKTFTILILTMILTVITNSAQTMPPLETGVSQTLAKWRAANYSDVRYKLNITLEKGAPLMKGTIEISVKLTDEAAKNGLILDWRTTQFANDKNKPFADVIRVNESVIKKLPDSGNYAYLIDKEHIVIAPRLLKTGENAIKIEFASPIKTSGAAITRYVDKEDGAEYVYSLFVPSDASTAFPVFDQPDLKARFKLSISSIFNSAKYFRTVITNSRLSSCNYSAYMVCTYEETQPISTYVFAFAAGDFAEFSDGGETGGNATAKERAESQVSETTNKNTLPGGRVSASKIYVRKSQTEKFKQHAAEVFRLNREGVRFLESWFDYKFPFPKYDLVLIPEFPFGGMEHAGATFLREDRVIFPTEPTKNDYITRANVIFHEAAHQWFGDTVTMKWFDDLWLKEGFAEFMAYKTMEKVMPEYNAWKIFYERNKQAAYLTDSTRGTTPIYQEIPNLSAAKSAYGNIVYRKAPSFLRQAEFYLGEDKFQTAVRQFLKKHEFANAEWTDLVKEFEAVFRNDEDRPTNSHPNPGIPYDIKAWADVWIKKPGIPIIRIYPYSYDGNYQIYVFDSEGLGLATLSYSQMDSLGGKSEWTQKVKFLQISENDKKVYLGILDSSKSIKKSEVKANGKLINQESIKQREIKLEDKVTIGVFPNYQDYGYGIFLLDERSRAYVLANILTEKDDFLRTMMWGALWDSVRETELAPKDYVELVIKNINVETDESTIQTLLGRVSTAMNYYLSDAQAATLAPKLEAVLIDKIQNAPTLGQRITFYRAFLNIVSSEKARMILKDILSGKSQIKDLKLKTKDRFDIVTKLLILSDKNAPNLLAELEKTELTDEAKRYAYAAKAGIASAENKAKFWMDFVGNKEISESWIESAFGSFNSPRHSELTFQYLEKALAELPSLKMNRKIFFVNGWLSAFIGGQKSEEALKIVNKFLADNPNLDKDLRLKILENSDNLERAVKIRGKYAE